MVRERSPRYRFLSEIDLRKCIVDELPFSSPVAFDRNAHILLKDEVDVLLLSCYRRGGRIVLRHWVVEMCQVGFMHNTDSPIESIPWRSAKMRDSCFSGTEFRTIFYDL